MSEQLELSNFYLVEGKTQSFEFFDAIPKFNYHRIFKRKEPIVHDKRFSHRGEEYNVKLYPATIIDKDGQVWNAHASKREELIYEVLKYMAVQKQYELGSENKPGGSLNIFIETSIYQIRKGLTKAGKGYKWSEIEESLRILQGANSELEKDSVKWVHSILNEVVFGKKGQIKVVFSTLSSQAILTGSHRPISYLHMMKLSPLARWIYKRMIHFLINGRCHKASMLEDNGFTKGIGLKLDYDLIVNESGIQEMSRHRNTVAKIKDSFEELRESDILENKIGIAWEETKKDSEWIIYPSNKTVTEIIEANKVFKK